MEFKVGNRVNVGPGIGTVTAVWYDIDWNEQRIRVCYDNWELAKTVGEPMFWAYAATPISDYSKVLMAQCPNCDEEMIFYYDDYICAWCREHLEEGDPWLY